MPSKLHPFWYTPALPFFFFGSAVAVGLAMTIFESTQEPKRWPGNSNYRCSFAWVELCWLRCG